MLETITQINNQLPIEGEFAVSPIIELSEDAFNVLNSDEQEELSSFKNNRRKQEYVTSRLMLKKMSQRMGMKEGEFCIFKDELGCPYGKCGTDDYFVSIAHTQNEVFCGITENTAIGVDLEPINRRVAERLEKRILHPNEDQSLKEIETIRLWTIKESLIKLEGQGLRMNMNEVQVKQDKKAFFVQINNDKTAKICSFQQANNWLAVAFYHNL